MVKFIKSSTKKENYPDTNAEVVFVGRSNVGKSSLINALYGKIAYVGKMPGKTTLLNFFNVDDKYTICDVPGYGYAKRSEKEIIAFSKMIDEYFETRKELKLCVVILDIRRIPSNDDLDMLDFLRSKNIPYLLVLNKCDKLSNNMRINQEKMIKESLGEDFVICVSCFKNVNIKNVAGVIKSQIEGY